MPTVPNKEFSGAVSSQFILDFDQRHSRKALRRRNNSNEFLLSKAGRKLRPQRTYSALRMRIEGGLHAAACTSRPRTLCEIVSLVALRFSFNEMAGPSILCLRPNECLTWGEFRRPQLRSERGRGRVTQDTCHGDLYGPLRKHDLWKQSLVVLRRP